MGLELGRIWVTIRFFPDFLSAFVPETLGSGIFGLRHRHHRQSRFGAVLY